jgi:general stress protein CsbA
MNIVLGILFGTLLVALFAPRITPRVWMGIVTWICLVVVYHYFKN